MHACETEHLSHVVLEHIAHNAVLIVESGAASAGPRGERQLKWRPTHIRAVLALKHGHSHLMDALAVPVLFVLRIGLSVSHHITPHHITSHHITSHHITSHHISSIKPEGCDGFDDRLAQIVVNAICLCRGDVLG